MMKLWLDDIRKPPDEGWTWASDAEMAMHILSTGHVTEVSLDHDLGDGVPTGYDVITWLERQYATGRMTRPIIIHIHTANPVGRARMEQARKKIMEVINEA